MESPLTTERRRGLRTAYERRYVLSEARTRGFFVRICFSGSIFAFTGVIDTADRRELYSWRGQTGRFISRSGRAWCPGKIPILQAIAV